MDLFSAMATFKRIVESGSISAVARQSGVAQPTVSKQLAALEQELGSKLINRSTRRLNLTEAGMEFYERCTQILENLEEARANVRQHHTQVSGTLRINAPLTFGRLHIAPKLWDYMAQHPQLNMELLLDDHYVDLVKEGIDLAIRIGPLADSNLIARKIGHSPRVTVASHEYLQAHGEPNNLDDLKHHNCIVYSLLTTHNEWHFSGPNGDEKIHVTGNFSTNSPDAIREAVLAGVGIAVTPLWLIEEELKHNKLKVILTDYKPTALEIHAIYPDRRFVPAKVLRFIEHLRETLNQQ